MNLFEPFATPFMARALIILGALAGTVVLVLTGLYLLAGLGGVACRRIVRRRAAAGPLDQATAGISTGVTG
ncbi:hypothetical protein AB0M44_42000 [Streptosporangium subroseum]|uniref:hypothetical protein n=1 Tax=Streptosporangium subroseum TaxID=106412 RepID=UPI00343F048A